MKPSLNVKDRLLARRRINPTTGCWEWTGCCHYQYGYGKFDRSQTVHRLAYKLFVGPIGDLCVLHKCDNPSCFNPNHLYLGTKRDNARDRDARGRRQPPVGALNGRTHLTDADVIAIRNFPKRAGQRVLAERYGISTSTVAQIVYGKTWKHLPVPAPGAATTMQ